MKRQIGIASLLFTSYFVVKSVASGSLVTIVDGMLFFAGLILAAVYGYLCWQVRQCPSPQ